MFPNIIKRENRIEFGDEIDNFFIKYDDIRSDLKGSKFNVIHRWTVLRSDYKLLYELSKAVLCLSYSTSKVESLFSEAKTFKTPYRNRLLTENLEASLMISQHFRGEDPVVLINMIEKYCNLGQEVNPEKSVPSITNQKSVVAPDHAEQQQN